MANLLMVIPKKIRRMCLAHTRNGKVDELERLTKSISQNTTLVKEKYGELQNIEEEVGFTLSKLKSETFETENGEIDSLKSLKAEEKKEFKSALVIIKDKGLKELTPIAGTAQRIRAHMLITMNKAAVQKAILIAKSKLASNASLQLDTLRVVEKESRSVNLELRDLLQELDILNNNAITSYTGFNKDVGLVTEKDTNAITKIIDKLEKVTPDRKE